MRRATALVIPMFEGLQLDPAGIVRRFPSRNHGDCAMSDHKKKGDHHKTSGNHDVGGNKKQDNSDTTEEGNRNQSKGHGGSQ